MDLLITINEGIDSAAAAGKYRTTFLCGIGSGSCPVCHPSCDGCSGSQCSSCKDGHATKSADGEYCHCTGSFGSNITPYHDSCAACHVNCQTCELAGLATACYSCTTGTALTSMAGGHCIHCDSSCLTCTDETPSGCTSCAFDGAQVSARGTCGCGEGKVYQDPAITDCVNCYSGCTQCADSSQAACMLYKDAAAFAVNAASSYNLPLLHQTNRLFCYNTPVPDLSCEPLTRLMGTVTTDTSGVHPTLIQCYDLLKADWPSVTSWFSQLFYDFTPPYDATDSEVYQLKTVLWLWILRFGYSELSYDSQFQELVAVFNNDSLIWSELLAWGGASPGYLAGGTLHTFPTALAPYSTELALFNRFSSVCASSCSYKAQCEEAAPGSPCTL